jgi:hypothetical protein
MSRIASMEHRLLMFPRFGDAAALRENAARSTHG